MEWKGISFLLESVRHFNGAGVKFLFIGAGPLLEDIRAVSQA